MLIVKNALFKWIAGLTVAVSQAAWAVPITDTVIVGTQEWAQVSLFSNVSWNAVSTQCPGGVCSASSTLNGYDLSGWNWASVDAVQSLFNTFTGQTNLAPNQYFEINSTWAPLFMSLFTPSSANPDGSSSVHGWSSTADLDGLGEAYAPAMLHSVNVGIPPIPPADMALGNITRSKDYTSPSFGAWFLRDSAPAPIPATLTLFGLGLVNLWIFGCKRGVKTWLFKACSGVLDLSQYSQANSTGRASACS